MKYILKEPSQKSLSGKKIQDTVIAKRKSKKKSDSDYQPPNFGKACRLPIADFADPARNNVCLEIDFPITSINNLSNVEGNVGKPIYQMSKWWARRRSSIFRSMLIASATLAPADPTQAAKCVWDHYYCNHQKAGTFNKIKVLDPFMGGGTTLVEGARLGFEMTGIDLNPVAWFVTKNELSYSDPTAVRDIFNHIEKEVKPVIQPFYTTTCPRGHKGIWRDIRTGSIANCELSHLPAEERKNYRWEGPEVIYTFWAKHGPCKKTGCNHRTPLFRSPIIAEKKLSASVIASTCTSCGKDFNIELGETRIAPGIERVILENEPAFIETSQKFARLLNEYNIGTKDEKKSRIKALLKIIDNQSGLNCPHCGQFCGDKIKRTLESHSRSQTVGDINKNDFGIESRHTYMYLLIHPEWLKGSPGKVGGKELGGYSGADLEDTKKWWSLRQENLTLIEVRGRIKLSDEVVQVSVDETESEVDENSDIVEEESDAKKYGLPREIVLKDGTKIHTRKGNIPDQAEFACQSCGLSQLLLESVKPTKHNPPVSPYVLQCYCPECDKEGYNYNGRYFKTVDSNDIQNLVNAEKEWILLSNSTLEPYWPKMPIEYSMRTHVKDPLPDHGYTHWWMLFNSRQLLIHARILSAIMNCDSQIFTLDIREQALGAFQQYLRNQNMFSIWNIQRDTPEPFFSNNNYNPKSLVIENSVFTDLGRGNWKASSDKIIEAVSWMKNPWELIITNSTDSKFKKSVKGYTEDPIINHHHLFCGSSTDLTSIVKESHDLIITDPPFGDNVYYADLADFFYVWLRIPLQKWYDGLPESNYFKPARTPRALEVIENSAEHPDNRDEWEKDRYIPKKHLEQIKTITQNQELKEKDLNPLFRPDPASDFYRQTLTACWTEGHRLLKPGGLLAFTFHHSDDLPWIDVLESLFNSGFILIAAYPIRSDETKGKKAQFGAKNIEYDIIHVCRKRLDAPEPVSWAKMRRWVKEETILLKNLLEHSHGKELLEPDLRVILRGKALQFYSIHYGQVFTGEGEVLRVRDALLGINQILDDIIQIQGTSGIQRPPEDAEPATRLFLRIFNGRTTLTRDELHKTLRGTGFAPGDFESLGWMKIIGTTAHSISVQERFAFFTTPGRTRKILKTDLDQAHFLIGAAMPDSGIEVTDELNRETFNVKRAVDSILAWYGETDSDDTIRTAANLALKLVSHWRKSEVTKKKVVQTTLSFD